MQYRYENIDLIIGAMLGGIDAATNVSPRHNFFGSAIIGAGGGAIHTLFSENKQWGTNIGSSLLTTTAISALTYYLARGMISAGNHHRHSYCPPPDRWSERVQQAQDMDRTPGR